MSDQAAFALRGGVHGAIEAYRLEARQPGGVWFGGGGDEV